MISSFYHYVGTIFITINIFLPSSLFCLILIFCSETTQELHMWKDLLWWSDKYCLKHSSDFSIAPSLSFPPSQAHILDLRTSSLNRQHLLLGVSESTNNF